MEVKGGCLVQQMGFSKRGGLLFFLLSGMKCQEDVEGKQAPAEPLSDSTSCRGCWNSARPGGSHIWGGFAISFSHIWSQRNNRESSTGKTGSKQFRSECKVMRRNRAMPYGQTPARAPCGFLNRNLNLVLPELNTTSTDNLPSLLFPQKTCAWTGMGYRWLYK